jgi:hypothetical protein
MPGLCEPCPGKTKAIADCRLPIANCSYSLHASAIATLDFNDQSEIGNRQLAMFLTIA